MRIHILGICGTFMGGLAMLARSLGHEVTADANVYPPMSTLLESQGIDLIQGYDPTQLDPVPDLVIIGNAMTRGNPCVEAVLERGIPYVSGRNGYTIMYCPSVGWWPLRVRMVKPRRRAWLPGYLRPVVMSQASLLAACRVTLTFLLVWVIAHSS